MCRHAFVVLAVLGASGCTDVVATKPAKAECDPTPADPPPNEDFDYLVANFSCDTDAIDTSFTIFSSSFASATSGGAALGSTAVTSAFEDAAEWWSVAGADVEISHSVGTTGSGVIDGFNNRFDVFMISGDKPVIFGGSTAMASTYRWHAGGEVLDCDIRFYEEVGLEIESISTSVIPWVASGTVNNSQVSLTLMMAHELGHCLGLGDQRVAELQDDVMFAERALGDDLASGVTLDSLAALLYLYGEAP